MLVNCQILDTLPRGAYERKYYDMYQTNTINNSYGD